ncbi:MAG: DMT family transporter [Bacteroidales bacterium]|nr:DMT family transporter [Bacteroidales bacterium]MBN2755914.1 DMT family transporter [Bacteroidales bacterium]
MNNKLAYFYAISAIMFWSTAAVAFKIALKYMDFIHLLFFSAITSFSILISILIIKKEFLTLFHFKPTQYLYSAFLGFLNPFAYYMILLKAYSILPAQIAQPLNYTWPILLVVFSVPLLKQKLSNKSIIAIIISFFGVILISSKGNPFLLKIDQPFGVFLASSSAVVWALFWIFNVKDNREEIIKLTLSFFFSIVFISITILFFTEFEIPNYKGLLASVYVGFFEMGFTFILWLKALQLTSKVEKISNLVFISPFFSLIWIHLILGENIYLTTILGLIFIISGIFIQQLKKRANTHKINEH